MNKLYRQVIMINMRSSAIFLIVFIFSLSDVFSQIDNSLNLHSVNITMPGRGAEYCTESHLRTCPLRNAVVAANTSTYDMKYLKMEFDIDPAERFLSGSVTSLFEIRQGVSSVEMELSTDYVVESIVSNSSSLNFTHNPPYNLIVHFPSQLEPGSNIEIKITYSGTPSASGFGSIEFAYIDQKPAMWTLSEPYGARDWWPGKNDLTDKIDSIDVIVKCPQQYRAASNGLLITDKIEGNFSINHWKHKYPIAAYLIAVAVADYAVYTDISYSQGKVVPILNYVYPAGLEAIMQQTATLIPVMSLFSDLFTQYPFIKEKYGHAQFGWGGGMEHQTMSFMGNFDFEIMAHELAHQWFGDMVTTGSWHDIWLNEGFATYMTGLTYEHLFDGYYWPFWKELNLMKVVSLPGGSVYVTDTTDVNRIFNSRLSYSKAALVLHSLRWVVGDDNFFTACRNYLNDSIAQYGFASTDLLKNHMESVSGIDLTEFFNDWYYGEGHPSYKLTINSGENFDYDMILSQVTSHSSVDFFEMPVPVLLKGRDRDTLIILNHTHNNQHFLINPGFDITDTTIDPDLWLISANNQILTDPDVQFLNVEVYPNPATDIVRVKTGKRKGNLYITDISGRIVKRINDFRDVEEINVSQFSAGIYYIRFTGNSSTKVPFMKL